MFERIDYRVIRIDGEYAYLQKLEDENAEEKCVAMALLPPEIQEGCHIAYEMMEYRIRSVLSGRNQFCGSRRTVYA